MGLPLGDAPKGDSGGQYHHRLLPAFYNATGGEYVIGHGGGAHAQHTYCTDISWDEAQPGDLVFYPEDEHVGIVGDWDDNGDLLIIHCASSANNVVITGASGFTSVAKPIFYSE